MPPFVTNILMLVYHLLHFLLRPIYAYTNRKKPPRIPAIKNPLLKLSACALAGNIRTRELSSRTVVEAYIERIKEVNPFLNAVTEDRFEAAVIEAKICDAKLESGEVTASVLEREKPLYGVPFTVKESCSLKGLNYSVGCMDRKGMKAPEDGWAVEMLKNAGGIPLCVTNTAELCSALHSMNFVYGETSNPYDLRKTSGGSSGGEGAMLGAGASVLGVGSDFIGSIRIPSLFNGIFGHKPTPGIISVKGHFPMSEDAMFQRILTIGPMARYVDDLYLSMKIMSSKCERNMRLDEPVDVEKLRVYYINSIDNCFGTRSTTQEMRRTIEKAISYLVERGVVVKQMSQPMLKEMFNLQLAVFGDVKLPDLLVDYQHPGRTKNPSLEYMKSLFGLSKHTIALTTMALLDHYNGFYTRSMIQRYRKIREDLSETFANQLGDNAVFICPTFTQVACYKGLQFYQIDGSIYSAIANFCQLPATHVPVGLNNNGMPIGFQVIAAPYQDRLCLAVAKNLEQAFGGWVPPPS